MIHLCYNEKDQRNLISVFFGPDLKLGLTQGRHNTECKIYHILCFSLLGLLQVREESDHCTKIK